MKTRNLFTAAMIAALAFTSCSKEDIATNDPNLIRFNASVDGMTLTRATLDGTGAGSFDNGDVWGINAQNLDADLVLDNVQYTLGTTTIYWDDINHIDQDVTFTACYPYNASISDPGIYMFNVATAANPDLLLTEPVVAKKGEPVNLIFRHAMHQLVINLQKDPSISGNLQDAKLTLLNMKSTAKVDILQGIVWANQAEGSSPYPVKNWGEVFYVAPQDLTLGNDWIKIELGGKTYTFKVPIVNSDTGNPTRLESGKRLTLTLKLTTGSGGRTAVAMSAEPITAWISQKEVTSDVDPN